MVKVVCVCVVLLPFALIGTLAAANETATLENRLRMHAASIQELAEIEPDLDAAADVLSQGICHFRGFCRSNPAASCLDIIYQEGISNRTQLPDGKYWVQPEILAESGLYQQSPFPIQIDCLMRNGEGWIMLFDDSHSEDVTQQFNSVVANMRFKQYLAFSTSDLRRGRGRQGYFYNVDMAHVNHPTSLGFSPNAMMDAAWVGQDEYGASVHGEDYPNRANHFRFKYFGKPSYLYTQTLYVLDDGDIGPRECLDLAHGRGTCFFDNSNAKLPQTCVNPRGIISFGCSDEQKDFTQCGTCKYSGYGDKANAVQNSVVRKMYVR